jgi:serine/threonine protein kinase
LNEKIDVWSLGNNVYALLTGREPFNSLEEEAIKNAVMNGEAPTNVDHYEAHSFAEHKLVDIIKECWEYDLNQRLDIFQIVDILRDAVAANENSSE